MSSSSEEQKTPRRKVRQRARRGAVSTEEQTPKKAVRKRVSTKAESAPRARTRTRAKTSAEPVKKREESKEVVEKATTEKRKAPTPFASSKVNQVKIRKRNIVLGAVMLIGIGSSAAVGLTDSGQINVNQTIEARNERLRNNDTVESDTESSVVSVPVQNTNNRLPNGGLVGRGSAATPPPPPPPPEPVSTSTATSSAASATSTDELIEEEEEVLEEGVEETAEEEVLSEESAAETGFEAETPVDEDVAEETTS